MTLYSQCVNTPNNISRQLLHEIIGKAERCAGSPVGQADSRVALAVTVKKVMIDAGIVPCHLLESQDAAHKYNCIIGIHPVAAIVM